MGKTRRGEREISRERRLVYENQQLKKQISKLRKQLARIDLDRYSSVKDIIEEHYQEERAEEGQEILENLQKTWKCLKCNVGFLEIICYNKMDDTWYFRRCSEFPICRHRTESQKYDSEKVKGIVKQSK